MKTFRLITAICGLGVMTIALYSCHDEMDLDPSTYVISSSEEDRLVPLEGDLKDFLDCHQFHTEDAVQDEDMIVVEDDIVLDQEQMDILRIEQLNQGENYLIEQLESMQEQYDSETEMIVQRQYAANKSTLIGMAQVSNIKYYIDPSVSNLNQGSEWYNAILAAVSDWTAVSNCKVSFTQVGSNSQANLSFYAKGSCPLSCMNSYSSSGIAKACFPKNSNVGRYITMKNAVLTAEAKKGAMRHEIGHALGFRHNNADDTEDENLPGDCGVSGLNLLQGTPDNDPVSIMNSTLLYLVVAPNDKKAIRFMYPENYVIPSFTSHSIIQTSPYKTVKLNVNSPGSVIPYEVIVTRHSTTSSSILQTTSFFDPYSDDTSFSVLSPNGTWRFRVWRRNFGNYYEISSYRTITVQ